MWLKEYTTALFKMQWGQNLIKFEGMQLPGGVTINGRQLYDDAMTDIERLRERIRLEFETPADFMVG
jgi:ABC-type phosphate transport system ATPase subunit